MPKPACWFLIACLSAAAAGCHKAPNAAASAVPASDSVFQASADPPQAVRLAIRLIAAQTPSAPRVVEPSHDLYDAPGSAKPTPADPSPSDTPGFRLTVPICRRAERMNDPLAQTAECAQLIQAAKDQAEACRQAFERGDDKSALSPACRQAAGFR